MEVQRIKTEGPYRKALRDQPRVVVEVDVQPSNGVVLAGHHLHGTARCEVYRDQVDLFLGKLQRAEHLAALEQAKTIAEVQRQEWIKSRNVKDPAERQKLLDESCPITPYTALRLLPGMKRGMPPLTRVQFVGKGGKLVDRVEDAELISPPITPENSARESMKSLSEAIAAALQANGQQTAELLAKAMKGNK